MGRENFIIYISKIKENTVIKTMLPLLLLLQSPKISTPYYHHSISFLIKQLTLEHKMTMFISLWLATHSLQVLSMWVMGNTCVRTSLMFKSEQYSFVYPLYNTLRWSIHKLRCFPFPGFVIVLLRTQKHK